MGLQKIVENRQLTVDSWQFQKIKKCKLII